MSTIITAYSHDAFKSFLLPAINDADYSIMLAETLFNISKDIELFLEVKDNKWYFIHSDEYELEYLSGKGDCFELSLEESVANGGNEFMVKADGHYIMSLVVRVSDEYFSVYEKYSLKDLPGVLEIGRDSSCHISYDFENKNFVESHHAIIFNTGNGFIFQDNSTNGSYLNNRRVNESHLLSFGECIDIFGLRIVFLGDCIAVNVNESGAKIDGNLLKKITHIAAPLDRVSHKKLTTIFHRSPRRLYTIDTDTIKIEDPPEPKEEVRNRGIMSAIGSAISMALPMLLGCAFMIYASQASGMTRGVFMYVGLVTAVTSATIGAIRGIASMKKSVKEYEEYERKRNEKYGTYLKEQEKIIKNKYEKNTAVLRERYISAKESSQYGCNQPLLWGRNVLQDDFLTHRLGLGDIYFQVEIIVPDHKFTMNDNNLTGIPANIKENYLKLKDVPVCVDLLEERLIGVVGGRRMQGGIAVVRSLVTQIAAHNSYTDVKLVFIYDEKKNGLGREWDFVKWLPHVWNETRTFRYVACDQKSASDVLFEIGKIIHERIENDSIDAGIKETIPRPYFIMIVAAPNLIEGERLSRYVLNPENLYGITTIYMVQKFEELPNQCEFIIENHVSYSESNKRFSGMYHTNVGYDDYQDIVFDDVSEKEITQFANRIANIEIEEIEIGGDVPNSVSFFEMYGVKKLDDFEVENRWKKNRTYESMRALIGQKAGGAPCYLDIHEKYHGPHGLVAGTTGSGKSETLQTYILSLSINFSPDDVGFFIIDYKGGGMANLFKNLPHLVGQISNLSGNQIQRALLSIQSEKDRREALFASYGVKDIRDYTKLYKNHEATVPLPHLIMVIDEFAEMKKEDPEFIQEIISISRVGRSLGIHLIMATQKPAGSVSDDIWSNSRFKLCLRVQSRQDSTDMLHKPDAAYLTQSGRCYLQVGNDELYELFQSGYSGAIYYEDEADVSMDVAQMLDIDGTPSLEGNHARSEKQKSKKYNWISQLLDVISMVIGSDSAKLRDATRADKEQIAGTVIAVLIRKGIDYPDTDSNRANMITLLEQIGELGFEIEAILVAESGFTNAKKKLPQQPERTQLEAVVSYLSNIAKKNHYNHDFSLFLPLLPEHLSLEDLPKGSGYDKDQLFDGLGWKLHDRVADIEICMGLYDDPENQSQEAFTVNFFRDGTIILFGAPTTGKSTFLQTLCFGLMMKYSPAEVNLYVMEFSAKKFSIIGESPHIGGIVKDSDDNERIEKFFTMLLRMMKERKDILGDIGFVQYCESYGSGILPAVIVIIDNFAALLNRTGDTYIQVVQKLIKEGLSCGIYTIVSATGTGGGEIPNIIAQNFRTPICLELNNAFDYSNYMKVSKVKITPESGVRGRGVGRVGERILEFQTAVMINTGNENEIHEKALAVIKKMKMCWESQGGNIPRQIPEIPTEPIWHDFCQLQEVKKMIESVNMLPLGYDTKFAECYGIDLSKIYVYLITGAKKKGKTNALRILADAAAQKGGDVVIVDFENKLSAFSEGIGAKYFQTEVGWAQYLRSLLNDDLVVRNRTKDDLRRNNADDAEIFSFMQKYRRISIFIENLPLFIERIQHPTEEGVPVNVMANMEMVIQKGDLHNIFWFATITKEDSLSVTATSLYKLFTRDRNGIHFGGAVMATGVGNMTFEKHDKKWLTLVKDPGIAMLPLDNDTDVKDVVLPLYKGR